MNKNFFQPVRMESQFVDTKLQSVLFMAEDAKAEIFDGAIVKLGDFAVEDVYSAAYTRAAGETRNILDLNAREAEFVAAATDKGIGVIDLPTVATADGMGNTYRMGNKTIGLKAEAGVPVRFRKLVEDDTFVIGEENTAELTVGEFATPGTDGKWVAAASEPAEGLYCKVVDKYTVSQGINANVTAYRLVVIAVA